MLSDLRPDPGSKTSKTVNFGPISCLIYLWIWTPVDVVRVTPGGCLGGGLGGVQPGRRPSRTRKLHLRSHVEHLPVAVRGGPRGLTRDSFGGRQNDLLGQRHGSPKGKFSTFYSKTVKMAKILEESGIRLTTVQKMTIFVTFFDRYIHQRVRYIHHRVRYIHHRVRYIRQRVRYIRQRVSKFIWPRTKERTTSS